jgi:hypothetical protein
MRHPRLFTYVFLAALLLLLAVPALAAAGGLAPVTAVDDTQSYSIARFAAQNPQLGAEFGYSVATDGSAVVVGARYETVGGQAKAGAVYVFYRTGPDTVGQVARLTAPTPTANQRFGQSVAIYEDTLVVGAPYDATKGDSAGAAYVYAGSWDRWNLEAKIYADDAQQYDRFGDAVATDGYRVVVGSRGRYSNGDEPNTNKTGAAYVFDREFTTWSQSQMLTDANGGPYQEFGASVAIEGDGWLFVGAPGDAVNSTTNTTGKVCVYKFGYPTLPAGAVGVHPMWNQEADLSVTGLASGDKFGSMMSWYEDYDYEAGDWYEYLVAGSAGNLLSWPDTPKAYEYEHVWGTDNPWTFLTSGTPADPGPMGAFSGSGTAFCSRGVFVGMNTFMTNSLANSGAVYFYGAPQDLSTGFEEALSVDAPGVLGNDFSLAFPYTGHTGWTATVATQPAHGDVTLAEDGSFIYTPDDEFWGTDTFTYTASAGGAASNAATVSIVVEEPGTYSLTYAAGAGGKIQGDPDQSVHQGFDGTPVTAVADQHYRFVEWSDGLKTATRTDTDVTEDVSVVAEFAPERTEVALSAPIGYMKPAPWRWYTYAGTMSPRCKVGAHEVVVTVQRKVDGHWKTYRKHSAETVKFSNTQTKYVISTYFKQTGAYRMRAKLDTNTQSGRSSWTFLRVNWKK